MTYATEILADSPLLYWKLDESTGQFQDSSGNLHPSISNTNLTRQTPGLTWEAGNYGVAVTTRTSNANAYVSDGTWADVTTATVELLFRTTAEPESLPMYLGGKWAATGAGQSLIARIASNGDIQVGLRTDSVLSTYYSYTPPSDVRNGLVHHIAYSYDPSIDTLALYLDGAQVATWTVAGTTMFSSSGQVGIAPGGIGRAPAYFDEFAYYGTALSATRIAAHATAAMPGAREYDNAMPVAATVNFFLNTTAVQEDNSAWGAAATGRYGTEIAKDRPWVWWRIAGTDSSGNDWNATTVIGPPSATKSLLYAESNGAQVFDGNDYYALNSSRYTNEINQGGTVTQWSAEIWMQAAPGSNTSGDVFWGSWGVVGAARRLAIGMTGSGYAYARVYTTPGGIADLTASTDLRDDQPHHIVATYDGTALRLYVDGQVSGINLVAGSLPATGYSVFLGQSNTGPYFTGILDEAALYETTLSAERVLAHYQAGSAYLADWWNGTDYQSAQIAGWWDGANLQDVEIVGWWDGNKIQPIERGDTTP